MKLSPIQNSITILMEMLVRRLPMANRAGRAGDPAATAAAADGIGRREHAAAREFSGPETLGLPPGIGVPSVLQLPLGGGYGTPCDFGACNGFAADPDVLELHHAFSQQLAAWLQREGINIDDCIIILDRGTHRLIDFRGIHTNAGGNWNRVWAQFKAGFENANREEMFAQARKMINDFGIPGSFSNPKRTHVGYYDVATLPAQS